MIFVLSGKETYTLVKRKNELLHKSGITSDNVVTIDGSSKSTFQMEAALNQCNTVSLFSDRRAVIIRDPYFLKGSSGKSEGKTSKKVKNQDDSSSLLQNYVFDPNPDTDLIFFCNGYDVDKRTKEYKVLAGGESSIVRFIQCSELKPWQMDQAIDDELRKRNLKLASDAKNELKLRVGTSMSEVYRTLDKLELYGGNQFNLKDIEHLASTNPEVNTWKLADAFLQQDSVGTLRSLKEITDNGTIPIMGLIPLLASKIRSMYCIVRAHECGLTNAQISQKLARKYPEKDLQSAHGHSSKYFLRLLSELADLDQQIKQGKVNDQEGFELFLLRNLKRGK